MRSLKALGLVSAIASIFMGAIPAFSQTFKGWTYFRTDEENIFFFTNSPITITVPSGRLVNKVLTSDSCGRIKYKDNPYNYVIFNGVKILTANLPQQISPSCNNGNLSEPRPNNYREATAFYIVGLTPSHPYNLQVPQDVVFRKTPNGCGFIRLKILPSLIFSNADKEAFFGPESNPLATDFSIPALPQAPTAPRCYVIDGVPRLFLPIGWEL